MVSNDSINVIEFNANGTSAIVAGDNCKLSLVDMSGQEMKAEELGCHQGLIWAGHFIENDKHVISTGYDCKIKLWDVANKKCIHEIPNNHVKGIWEILYKDGKIYTTGNDGTSRCIDFETSTELYSFKVSRSFVWNLLPLWSRNLLVATSQDSVVHFLDYRVPSKVGYTKADEQLSHIKHHPIAWPDLLVSGDSQGAVQLWDIRQISSTSVSFNLPVINSIYLYPFNIRDIIFDDTKCIVATKDKSIRMFDLQMLMTGSKWDSCLKWVVESVDGYRMEMDERRLVVGTRAGELVRYDFGKDEVGWWEEGCRVM